MAALNNSTEILKRAQMRRRAQVLAQEHLANLAAAALSAKRPAKAAWSASAGWLRGSGARGTGKQE